MDMRDRISMGAWSLYICVYIGIVQRGRSSIFEEPRIRYLLVLVPWNDDSKAGEKESPG